MTPEVGVHLLVNLYNIPTILLEKLTIGLPFLDKIVHELKLTVVSQTGHQFVPLGYSYAYVLSESHFTVHTYPEFQSCYFDIFCCNPNFNPLHALDIIKTTFKSDNIQYQIVKR